MIRFGKAKVQGLRALASLQIMNSGRVQLAISVIWYTTARERKAVRQLHRQMLLKREQP